MLGKTLNPGRVRFQLNFIGKVGLVFWKLSLEDFTGISGNNKPIKTFHLDLNFEIDNVRYKVISNGGTVLTECTNQ